MAGGHYAGDAKARKIWHSGLWWPTTLKDSIRYAKEWDLCQWMGQPTEQARMPHQPVLPLEPFQKWGLNFVGPFKPPTMKTGNRYIIVPTDYCTKWVEAKSGTIPIWVHLVSLWMFNKVDQWSRRTFPWPSGGEPNVILCGCTQAQHSILSAGQRIGWIHQQDLAEHPPENSQWKPDRLGHEAT